MVTLAKVADAGGTIAAGTLCLSPSDARGNLLTLSAPGFGLLAKGARFCGTIAAGALTAPIAVPDACHTNYPTAISYDFTLQVLDANGNPSRSPIVVNGVPGVCGASYAFDQYAPAAVSGSVTPTVNVTPLAIGTVSTLNPGTPATVTISGPVTAPLLNFGIPQGPAGSGGITAQQVPTLAADGSILASQATSGTGVDVVANANTAVNQVISVGPSGGRAHHRLPLVRGFGDPRPDPRL